MRTLVTGGVRSGKSRHAEQLLGERAATYIAAGPSPAAEADPDWLARIRAHRARRPALWATVETGDVATAIAQAATPVLVDCVGTWLTAIIDNALPDGGAWSWPTVRLNDLVEAHTQTMVDVVQSHPHDVVIVTNEVGLSVVPEHRSGRVFRDLLGTANQRLATICDEVHLVVCGRVIRL